MNRPAAASVLIGADSSFARRDVGSAQSFGVIQTSPRQKGMCMYGDHRRQGSGRLSRRRVLTAAAAVGVGGAAVSVAGLSLAQDAPDAGGEALVVHVRDARAGKLDVFLGTRRIEIRDRDLVARLLKAARRH